MSILLIVLAEVLRPQPDGYIICTIEQGFMSDYIREGFTKNLSNYGYCIAICL